MNVLSVREDHLKWPNDNQVELLIDGVPLIELIREVELPHAKREYEERPGELETEDQLAGDYLYLSPQRTFLPSETLFGEPSDEAGHFGTEAPCKQSTLLTCTCGVPTCWFLLATIEVGADVVVWRDFKQFWRDWDYPLGPFRFEGSAYRRVLTR